MRVRVPIPVFLFLSPASAASAMYKCRHHGHSRHTSMYAILHALVARSPLMVFAMLRRGVLLVMVAYDFAVPPALCVASYNAWPSGFRPLSYHEHAFSLPPDTNILYPTKICCHVVTERCKGYRCRTRGGRVSSEGEPGSKL